MIESQSPFSPRPNGTPDTYGVVLRDGVYHLVALAPIAPGAVILTLSGLFVSMPSRFSIQVQEHLHVSPAPGLGRDERPDLFPWRYLNHACDPSAYLDGLRLVARRAIEAWDEITFDYDTTELELAEPFECACGGCAGRTIRGFAFLSAEEREMRASYLSPHLRERAKAHS